MQKAIYFWKHDHWELSTTRYYLYDGMLEIGSTDEEGHLVDLRVLGASPQAEAGATIAIELNNRVFVPLHDLRGNIVGLVQPPHKDHHEAKHCDKLCHHNHLLEVYRYSAFGELRIFNKQGQEIPHSHVYNPWLFFGKRLDEESGLIYFGRRYYHPHLSKWITPDPAGAIDRPNLYAFLRGNPMGFFDALGLNSESLELRHNWQHEHTAVSHGLSTFFSAIAKPIGYALYYGGYHLPLPWVRDGIVATGAWLAQSGHQGVEHSSFQVYKGNLELPWFFPIYVILRPLRFCEF